MRYVPSDRFWRNFLLTCVFTICTLGFSVAQWNGYTLRPADHTRPQALGGKQLPQPGLEMADLRTTKAGLTSTGSGTATDVSSEVVPPATAAATFPARGTSEVAGSRDFAGARRPQATRGNNTSSGSPSGGSRGIGGAAGGYFGAKNSKAGQDRSGQVSTIQTRHTSRSNGGSSTKGKSSKTKTTTGSKTADSTAPPVGSEGGYSAPSTAPRSPASTPEPLSMILVGTGLAGLYRVRKHLM